MIVLSEASVRGRRKNRKFYGSGKHDSDLNRSSLKHTYEMQYIRFKSIERLTSYFIDGKFQDLTVSIVWEMKDGVNFIARHVAGHGPQLQHTKPSNSIAVSDILVNVKILTSLLAIKIYGRRRRKRRRVLSSTLWRCVVWHKFMKILELSPISILRIEYFRRSHMDLHHRTKFIVFSIMRRSNLSQFSVTHFLA